MRTARLRSLLRRGVGGWLPVLQIALTLAILANSGGIIVTQYRLLARPSGLDEAGLFSIVLHAMDQQVYSSQRSEKDVALLRSLPGVTAATRINALPLGNAGWRTVIGTAPIPAGGETLHAALYFSNSMGPATLGVRITAGRAFTAADEVPVSQTQFGRPQVALISQHLARRLFGGASPLGRRVYTRLADPVQVIGVIERLESAWVDWAFDDDSIWLPARLESFDAIYLVRIEPAQRPRMMAAAAQGLRGLGDGRIVEAPTAFSTTRRTVYLPKRALIVSLAVLLTALVIVAAMGTYGVARYRLARSVREIGTRRALGARRRDIVQYFLLDNLLMTGVGVSLGVLLAYGLDRMLTSTAALPPLPGYCAIAAAAVLVLSGQLAVLGVALRAARIAPAAATRSA